MPLEIDAAHNANLSADGTDYPNAVETTVRAYGPGCSTGYVPTADGGMVLVQYLCPATWATLAPEVAARSPDAPLVSHLDSAGMRDCLRAAAVDSEGD